jgi:hypothetical protein
MKILIYQNLDKKLFAINPILHCEGSQGFNYIGRGCIDRSVLEQKTLGNSMQKIQGETLLIKAKEFVANCTKVMAIVAGCCVEIGNFHCSKLQSIGISAAK